MITKKLSRHGNSLALVIDRSILELLGIDTRRVALEEEPLGRGSALAKCLSAFAARIDRLGSANLAFREEGFSWATQNV